MRPWIVTSLTPACSAIRAISGAFKEASSQPRRVFNVTGKDTALTTASQMRFTRSGSRIRADPDTLPVTFLAGQPILISMRLTPNCSAICAASAIICGSHPTICKPIGASLRKSAEIFFISVRMSVSMA